METKRNDPCPCGSGKKYKHCCGRAQRPDLTVLPSTRKKAGGPPPDPERSRKRMNAAVKTLLKFGSVHFGEADLDEAMEFFTECVLTDEDGRSDYPADDPLFQLLFAPWWVTMWTPDDDVPPAEHEGEPSPSTVAAAWLGHQERHPRMVHVVEALRREPLSFWQVSEIDPGRGIVMRDLIIDREVFVYDRMLSRNVDRWSIMFAQVVEIEGVTILGGTSPLAFPPHAEGFIESFADRFTRDRTLSPIDLLEYDVDLLMCLGLLLEPGSAGSLPELATSDGEPLISVESTFEFDRAERDSIVSTLRAQPEMQAEDIDPEGNRIIFDEPKSTLEFVWTDPQPDDVMMPRSIYGQIEVGDAAIMTSVMSRERDEAIRSKLEAWLGQRIRFVGSEEEDILELLQSEDRPMPDKPPAGSELPPEAIEAVGSFMRRQLDIWIDEPVPALDGRTPREAVETAEGRVVVAQILREWEHSDGQSLSGPSLGSAAFDDVRRKLGLDDDTSLQ